jgi:hypothetical protein
VTAMLLHEVAEKAYPPSRMGEILGGFHRHFVEWLHDIATSHAGRCVDLGCLLE